MDLLYDCKEDDFDAILAEMEKEIGMGDVMRELGYGCTVNDLQCKETLSLFSPLTEVTLSRIIGTIARTHIGLEDNHSTASSFAMALGNTSWSDLPSPSSWNIDILVDSIKQLVSLTFLILSLALILCVERILRNPSLNTGA